MERKNQGSFTKLMVFASALVLLVAFVGINANITGEQTEITKMAITDPSQVSLHTWPGAGSKDVVWDNGMYYDNGAASQNDPISGLDPIVADDFQFDVDQLINDVHWIGAYWNGPPDDGDFDWKVTFYNDIGDGTKPGTVINTWIFSNDQVNETFIEGTTGGTNWFSYSVNLPTPINFIAGANYWISVQGIGAFPPQSGWAMHSDQIILHQAVFKSNYFGYPDWTNISSIFGVAGDMCFQLTYEEPWPDHKMHFPQLPDLIGWDVKATLPFTLADDWQCSETGLVTDIHFWGSWKNRDGDPVTDEVGQIQFFRFGIWSNLPVGHPQNPYSYSIPGTLLWSREEWVPGTPTEPPTIESWYDPYTPPDGWLLSMDHVTYWQYDFMDIPDPFIQKQDSIYWLSISAVLEDPQNFQWGWKNSRDHFEDNAVYTLSEGVSWGEIYEPMRENLFDVSFDAAGIPIDLGSINYYGDSWYYYEESNWWNIWFYDNPFNYDNFKEIVVGLTVETIGPEPFVEFAINWSTDIWSLEGVPDRPPLPEDELVNPDFIGRWYYPVMIGFNDIDYTILDYNPEWISIDFRARDVRISGCISHECVQTPMDLAFVITGEALPPLEYDFGDAPDPTFPTLLVNDGARHIIVPNIYLGATIDPDPDGQPDPNALGDDNDGTDDEDGVVFTSLLYPGSPAKVKVTASVPGYLNAWVDFNADGDWDDPQEKIFISKALAAGPNDLFYFVPTDAVAGPAISRFRFSTEDTLWKYTGEAPDGEVEDYEVEILEPIGDLKMHYLQPPDLEGWDIHATQQTEYEPVLGTMVADDWRCTETGPVTDIHFWGSWRNGVVGSIEGFWISIYSNIPGPPYSQPGEELWSAFITFFVETPMEPFPQGWYDPADSWWQHPNHAMWFRYDITGIENPFIQEQGTIYWLSIRAAVPYMWPEVPLWGWKTSYEHFEDNAMWGVYDPVPPHIWFVEPLIDPISQLPVDMAFAITGGVPVICGDANNSGAVNVGDAIYILSYLFKGGAAPIPYLCVGDVNNSDSVNLTDAIYILNYLFKGGAAPNPDCCNPVWAK